jgi:HK97 family phage major capsid protein
MREVSEVITGGAKSIELLIDDDEAVVRRIGEGASGGETDTPDIGLKVIVAHKYEAAPKVTIEMVQDADFDVEGWLGRKVSNKITRTENADFVNGTGVNAARGFLTLPAWASAGVYEREKIEQVNMGAAAALDPDGLIDVQGSLHEAYQPGASWVMHRTTYSKALQLKGADQYHFGPVLLRDGQAQTVLLNKPVRFMADMPTVAANALAVAYGDWRMGYTIYDRVGVIVLRDPYSAHGFITYYTTKRTGGDVTSYDAIKIGKVAA